MGNANPNVAIRLGTTGLDQVRTDLEAFGEAGDKNVQRVVNGFTRLSGEADAAASRAEAAGRKVAAVLNISTPNGQSVAIGPQQNAAMQAYTAYMAQQQRQAETLRNVIDPLRVAQKQYDDEIEVARGLLSRQQITEEEYAAAVRKSGETLKEARARYAEGAEGLNNLGAAGLIAGHVVRSFSDSVAAGQSPIRAAQMEFPRVIEGLNLWAVQSGVTEGAIGKVAKFMGGPWGLAITLGVTALGPLIGELLHTDDAAEKAAAQGLKSFEDRQKEMAKYIDANTGRIRDQYRAMLLLSTAQFPAAIQGKAGETQGFTNSAFKASRDALDAIGTNRADVSMRSALAKAITDAGSNSDKLAKNIDALVTRYPKLTGLANTVGDFASKAVQGAQAIQQMQGAQAEWNARLSGAVPLTTDLAKTLVDRALATDKVSAAQQRLSEIEAKKADLDAMPYGPKQQAAIKAWQTELTSARRAVEQAQASERAAAAATRDHTKELGEQKRAAEASARALAEMYTKLEKSGFAGTKSIVADLDKTQFAEIHKAQDAAQAERMVPGDYVVGQIAAQQEAARLGQAELSSVTMGADQRERYLAAIQAIVGLQKNNVDLSSDDARAVLSGVDAQAQLNEQIRRGSAAMEEIRGFAGGLIDDLAQGKIKASDLLAEFIKLAALNPLKNLLGGSHQTTLTDVIGSVSKILGGSSLTAMTGAQINSTLAAANVTAHFAAGTDYAPGGTAWVGENGPELVRLPRGTSVTPAAQSRQLMAANANGDTHNHFHIEGNLLTPEFWGQIQAMSDTAATRGAYGGARIARSNDLRRQARTITR